MEFDRDYALRTGRCGVGTDGGGDVRLRQIIAGRVVVRSVAASGVGPLSVVASTVGERLTAPQFAMIG